ncbi:MAG TPA: efflux RND transporter periplasmic adaptor subunit [Azospirillaceae bacterium]|nr:efflux RND transporter periplasmic adaptor subunit [Azospirillaceae bacterium]
MWKPLALGGLLLALLLAFGLPTGSGGAGDDASWPTVAVARGTLAETVAATGIVKVAVGGEVKVGAQVSGVVARLAVGVGDRVERGDLLAQIDDARLRAQQDLRRAELRAALAEVELARAEAERKARLAGTAAAAEIDRSRSALAWKSALAQAARARLEEAEIMLGQARVTAPIAGVIASVSTYQGETVAASFQAPTFVTILDPARLEVQAYVDEADIGRIRVGQPVTFQVEAFRGRHLPGVVRAVQPRAVPVNNVVTYVVVVAIGEAPAVELRPEMTAHVTVPLEQRDAVLSLPRGAVLEEGGEAFALVRGEDGWTRRPLRLGLRTPQRVEVLDGLGEGERVLADAQRWRETAGEGAR